MMFVSVPIEKTSVDLHRSAPATLQLKITGTYEHKSRNLDSAAASTSEQFMTNNNFIEMSDSEEAEDRNSSQTLTVSLEDNNNNNNNNNNGNRNKNEELKNGKRPWVLLRLNIMLDGST